MADPIMELGDEDLTYLVIGHLTVNWAYCEIALDGIIAIAFRQCGGSAIEPEAPASTKRKIAYLRKAFRDLPDFQEFEPDAIPLLDRAAALKNSRHEIVHSAVMTYGYNVEVFSIKASGNTHKGSTAKRDLVAMNKDGHKATQLAIDLAELAGRLIRKLVPQKHDA
ncbi:hypothetical protein [Dongia sp.]|uniref:hypothetical protein n=1 Tax=Dongia sp. TaxID=1977262 RepID=UPI003751CEB4